MNSNNMEDSDTESVDNENTYIYAGLVLKENYILLTNIGAGNNGNVWLAYAINHDKYYALKVQFNEGFKDGCKEIAICRKIKNYMDKNPENFYCIKLIDYFIYEVKNSIGDTIKYACTVLELYDLTIGALLTKGKHKYGFPIDIVKKILKKIVSTVNILHKYINVVHTDIKPDNIMIKSKNNKHNEMIAFFEKSKFREKYQQILLVATKHSEEYNESLNDIVFELIDNFNQLHIKNTDPVNNSITESSSDCSDCSDCNLENSVSDIESENDNVVHKLNERRQSIDDIISDTDESLKHDLDLIYDFTEILNNKANSTDKISLIDDEDITNCQIALIDFGNAYFLNDLTKDEIQARKYRAPEIILDLNYGCSCDIWSIGCIAFEMATGFSLFDVYNDIEVYPPNMFGNGKPLNLDIHHLYMMEKMLGKIPKDMKEMSCRKDFLFDKNTLDIKHVLPFKHVSIKDRLITQFLLSDDDATNLSDFICQCLIYEPEKRITAENLLKHKFFN